MASMNKNRGCTRTSARRVPFYMTRFDNVPIAHSGKGDCIKGITKTCRYNFDPLKPHFYIVKLGFILFCLFLLNKIECGYSLEPPRRGGSNEYPQSMFWEENWKKVLVVKFSMYLDRRVFVMERFALSVFPFTHTGLFEYIYLANRVFHS